MTLSEVCRDLTHIGARFYINGHFGCDACAREGADK